MLQELLAQKTFSPLGLAQVKVSDGQPVFYISIKSAEAENLLQQFRVKTAGSNYCPVIVQDADTLTKLAAEADWRPVTVEMSIENIARQIAQLESISILQAEEQAKYMQQLWSIEDGNLKLNCSTQQIVSASETCNLDQWFQLKEKLKGPPKLNQSGGRPKVARHLRILGPQPDSIDENEIAANLKASPTTMVGGSSYDSKTGITTEILQITTTKREPPIEVNAQMIEEYKEMLANLAPKELLLCFVPVKHSWQIPAFFSFGYYRKPSPLIHTAVLKRLHDKFGAQVAVISTGDLEVTLQTIPSASELETLSKELSLYNEYFAGYDMEDFRRFLAKSTVWNFCW